MTEITSLAELKAQISDADHKLIVLEFTAEWCGPCKKIQPKIEEWAKTHHKSVVFLTCDVDKADSDMMSNPEFGVVETMPIFFFIREKGEGELQVLDKMFGSMPSLVESEFKKHFQVPRKEQVPTKNVDVTNQENVPTDRQKRERDETVAPP